VSQDATNNRVIREATEGWMVEDTLCVTLEQARTFLVSRDATVVFCQDVLPDGTYRDLLSSTRVLARKAAIVVMVSEANRDSVPLEAPRLGAFDLIASPCSKQDVQWAIIRVVNTASHRHKT